MMKYSLLRQKKPAVSENTPIYRYPSDTELADMRISELKKTGLKAIQFYSELLKDYFYFAIDGSIIPELLKENIPVYTIPEILILANAPDDQTRQQLHKFKRTFPGARIYKNREEKR